MRAALMSVFLVALTAACGGVGSPAEQDVECTVYPKSGRQVRNVVSAMKEIARLAGG
jgi:hypothetical protein